MADQADQSTLSIVVTDSPSGRVSLGPLYVMPDAPWRTSEGGHDFIFGPIEVVAEDGTPFTRESENGIDSLRLAYFRSDLLLLDQARRGGIRLGDHDYSEILTFIANGDAVQVQFTHPSLDIWDLEVAAMPWDRVPAIVQQIDQVERVFGPLNGCCGACGTPRSTYSPTPAPDHEFLVTYDYDTGRLSAVVRADSERAIAELYPELAITPVRAGWINDPHFRAVRDQTAIALASPPSGILAAVIADRRT